MSFVEKFLKSVQMPLLKFCWRTALLENEKRYYDRSRACIDSQHIEFIDGRFIGHQGYQLP